MTKNALHGDLQILTVNDIATRGCKKFHSKLHSNPNPPISRMSSITISINTPRLIEKTKKKMAWRRSYLERKKSVSFTLKSKNP